MGIGREEEGKEKGKERELKMPLLTLKTEGP